MAPLFGNGFSSRPMGGTLNNALNSSRDSKIKLSASYRIIIRSFIGASSVGFGPSQFFGDNRRPTAEVNPSIGFRAIQEFDIFINRGSYHLNVYEQPSSLTIGIIPLPTTTSIYPLIIADRAETHHLPSVVRRTRSATGHITNSFKTAYWAKDPVTPQFFTPALDVQAQFTLTAYEELGLLRVTAKVTGDIFPSTEVLIVNPSRHEGNVLLGAHMERGGLLDLFLDNRRQLFEVDVDLKLDEWGGFTGVRDRKRNQVLPSFIRSWNQKVIRQACQHRS